MENKNKKAQILNLGNIEMHNPKFTNQTTTKTKPKTGEGEMFLEDKADKPTGDISMPGLHVDGKTGAVTIGKPPKKTKVDAESVSLVGLSDEDKQTIIKMVQRFKGK